MKETEIRMNKLVSLELPILELSKTVMYEFWCDYVKLIYEKKPKVCNMDTVSFIVYIKIDDIAEDVEMRSDTSNYELKRPPPKGKNKVIGLMKDELAGK